MRYVVCYDITRDRTRNRVRKLLNGYGERVQYSVFECPIDAKQLCQLRSKLAEFALEGKDSIRVIATREKVSRESWVV